MEVIVNFKKKSCDVARTMSSYIINFTNGKVTLLDKSITDSIVLDATYKGEVISVIGSRACPSGSLRSLDLTKTSITALEDSSFSGCNNLEEVSLPDSLKTIDRDAFRGCPITSFHIPKLLERFDGAFNHCGKLKSFDVDANNTHFDVDQNIVYSKDHKKLVRGSCEAQFENIAYINVLEELQQYAFSNTEIRNFVAGPSLMYLKRGVFEACTKLEDVNLLRSKVQTIEAVCFLNANLIHMILPKRLLKISPEAFKQCNISQLVIPNSIKSIEYSAFNNQKGELTIFYYGKNSFETIEFFKDCKSTPLVYVPLSYKHEKLSSVNVIKCNMELICAPYANKCTYSAKSNNNMIFALVFLLRY